MMNLNMHQSAGNLPNTLRDDLAQIVKWIPAGCRLLDVGCDDGTLMAELRDRKGVQAQGIELNGHKVSQAIRKNLSVIQGDANIDLQDYAHAGFDVVVLSQTLQAMQQPRKILQQLRQIAPRVIVSTPNFAYWRGIMQLLWRGRMPMTRHLPIMWYDTPNIHLCTLTDLLELVALEEFLVIEGVCFDAEMRAKPWSIDSVLARLLAVQGLLLLERQA